MAPTVDITTRVQSAWKIPGVDTAIKERGRKCVCWEDRKDQRHHTPVLGAGLMPFVPHWIVMNTRVVLGVSPIHGVDGARKEDKEEEDKEEDRVKAWVKM